MDTSEGLVPLRNGYANPLYGSNEWWGGGFNETNYQDVMVNVSGGIKVPTFMLALDALNDVYGAYEKCSPLQAICNRIAEALMNGTWKIVDKKEDDMSASSIENKTIVKLLTRPNPLQTYSDFLKQIAIYRNVYGGAYIYAAMPSGFKDVKDAIALWVFSPDEVEVLYKRNIYTAKKIEQIVEKYVVTPKEGDTKEFDVKPQFMLPIYDTTEKPILSNGRTSGKRVKANFYEIRNIMQAQEAIYSLNSDRGAQGIISNVAKDAMGYVPMTTAEKEGLQNRFRASYGLRRDQDKVFITDAAVTYTPIGFDVKQLMVFEGVRENIMHLCDSFNYPFDLLASEKGKTAADKRTSMWGLYQDNIIPLANDISGKLTLWFGLDEDTQRIKMDFSHLPIFQQGNVDKNNALRQLMQALHIAYNSDTVSREEFRRFIGLAPELEGTLRSETAAAPSRDDIRTTQV
jgi:hypothetical protein